MNGSRARDPDPPPWTLDELADFHAGVMEQTRAVEFSRRVAADAEAQRVLRALDRTAEELRLFGHQLPPRRTDFAARYRGALPVPTSDLVGAPGPAPVSARRRRLPRRVLGLGTAAASFLVLIVLAVVELWGAGGPGAGGGAQPGPLPNPSVGNVPAHFEQPDVARLELTVSGVTGATVYFGRLGALATAVRPQQNLAIDPTFLRTHGDTCAETVVVSGVPGTTAAVYAIGLAPGWGAAEAAPPQVPAGPDRTIHQQAITPPTALAAGTTFTGSARVLGDAVDSTANAFGLTLTHQVADTQYWSVGTNGLSITCTTT